MPLTARVMVRDLAIAMSGLVSVALAMDMAIRGHGFASQTNPFGGMRKAARRKRQQQSNTKQQVHQRPHCALPSSLAATCQSPQFIPEEGRYHSKSVRATRSRISGSEPLCKAITPRRSSALRQRLILGRLAPTASATIALGDPTPRALWAKIPAPLLAHLIDKLSAIAKRRPVIATHYHL